MKKAEIADRFTILVLKSEAGLQVEKELHKFQKETEDVPDDLMDKLYVVNAKMWEIEEQAEHSKENIVNAGELFIKQRELNKERVAIKNEISNHFNENRELKSYDVSHPDQQ